MGKRDAAAIVVPLLADPDERVREEATRALRYMCDGHATAGIITALLARIR